MESRPSEEPTSKPPPNVVPPDAGWDVRLLSSDGKRTTVVRMVRPPPFGALPAYDGAQGGNAQVVGVECSVCHRGARSFVVPHDPASCARAYAPDAGSLAYRSMGRAPVGPPKVLPRDRRTKAYKRVRRELGLGA